MRTNAEDMVVVITGASRGIGRATARRFAERGASVVLAARSEGALLGAAAECEALGGEALAVPTDGGFNRGAKRRAALGVRRAVAAGASVLGPGILTWLLLRRGVTRRK